MEVKLNDTLPMFAGNNLDTLESPLMGWGPYANCSGNYTFHFDPQHAKIYHLKITAARLLQQEVIYDISVDSISISSLLDSEWILAGDSWPCSYYAHYHNKYMMISGNFGEDSASGEGQTTLFTSNAASSVELSPAADSSLSISVTSLGNGAVQIERPTSGRAENIEIFDALGRAIAHAIINGNEARFSNLPPGCYFARLGDEVAKFIVPPR